MGGSAVARELRLVLFGDGAWAAGSLEQLQGGPHRVIAVVARAQPSGPALAAAAAAHGLPLLQPWRVNDDAFLARLQDLAPDLGLSIAYDQIFGRRLLAGIPCGFLNFHAGALPRYRGRNVITWAILNGEPELGVTAHFVDEGVDTGDILLQRTVPIGWTDTYGDVLCRVVQLMPSLVEESVALVAGGSFSVTPQRELAGTYFAGRTHGDEWLDWSDTSEHLHNKVRAISRPAPGARTLLDGRPVVIWRAYFDPAWPRYRATPGQVVGRRDDGVLVKTGDSTLLVQEVEVAGTPSGCPRWRVGTRLGINLAAVLPELLARVAALEGSRV